MMMINSDSESHNEVQYSNPLSIQDQSDGEQSLGNLGELPHLNQFRGQQNRGRPPLQKRVQSDQNGYLEYIQQDQYAATILQFIVNAGTVKNKCSYRLGPYRKVQKENQVLYKKIDGMIEELKLVDCKNFMFISQKKRNYQFQDGKIIDKTQYLSIDYHEAYPNLYLGIYRSLQLVCKQLAYYFVPVMQIIFNTYVNMHMKSCDNKEIIKELMDQLNIDHNLKIIREWVKIKNIQKAHTIIRKQYEIIEQMDTLMNKCANKVIVKHEKMLNKQQDDLQEELKCHPWERLLSQLFQTFNLIIDNTIVKSKLE